MSAKELLKKRHSAAFGKEIYLINHVLIPKITAKIISLLDPDRN